MDEEETPAPSSLLLPVAAQGAARLLCRGEKAHKERPDCCTNQCV